MEGGESGLEGGGVRGRLREYWNELLKSSMLQETKSPFLYKQRMLEFNVECMVHCNLLYGLSNALLFSDVKEVYFLFSQLAKTKRDIKSISPVFLSRCETAAR